MTERIIRVNKSYRRKVILIYVVIVCLGGVMLGWGLPWAERFLGQQDLDTALRVVKATLVVVFLSMVVPGLYVFRLGRSVLEHDRFPPPGREVLRDTRLMEGEEARTRGRLLVFLSLLLIMFGLLGAFSVPHVLDELAGAGSRPEEPAAESGLQQINPARISR